MDLREELVALRRMAELEAKASGGIPSGRTGVSQIPTEPGANLAPTVAPEQTFMQKLIGYAEAPLAVGATLAGGLPIYLAGAGGPEFQRKVAGEIQYQPRTQQAQEAVEAVGRGAEALKLPPVLSGGFGAATRSIAPAMRAISDIGRAEGSLVGNALAAPLAARAARNQEAKVAQSYANAPMIDATASVQRLGGAVPPAISNPTLPNVIKGKLAGPEVETQIAKVNEKAVTDRVREDLGLAPTARLNASAVDQALDIAGKPNDVVKAIPILTPDAAIISQLEALKKPASAVAKGRVEASNALIDDLMKEISAGRSGAEVLNDIRTLRKEAIDVYKRKDKGINPPSAPELAEAEARLGAANVYEQLIDANVTDPNILANIRAARTKQAQIYQHARALDYAKEKVDPQSYVKMFEESQGKITGIGADIAKAASTFPSVFTLVPAEVKGLPRITRGGVLAAIGGAAGVPFGPAGVLAGTAIGMGAGSAAGGAAARRMATPAYQAAHAMPPDYRPPVNMLRPVEPNVTLNALVPYDYAQSTFTPPNFVMPPNQYPPRTAFVGPETGTPQLGMGREPVGGGQTAALRAEDARLRALHERQDLQAQAAAAQAETAARQPTRGGTPMVFDERGRLVPADQTLRGATPNIQIIESTGKNLSGAAELLASGKSPALMSAEQKIAWEKTKVDLADVVPGMKALDDKTIAAKMMDRAWIQEAITKANEKAGAYDALSKRDISAQRIREAAIERDRLQGIAESLQEQLSAPRPVQRGGQGPKTRAAQRGKNALMPTEEDIKNALAR